jgi:tryptophan-rich sensory protein
MLKKVFFFVLCFSSWYITNLLPINYKYFNSISKPFFTPPPIFYGISWTIIYFLITLTFYYVIITYKFKEIPLSYKITILINYLLNELFPIVFFLLKNNFLGFIISLLIFISSLFLYEETSLIENKVKNLLIPYILLSLFATILSLSIYLIN